MGESLSQISMMALSMLVADAAMTFTGIWTYLGAESFQGLKLFTGLLARYPPVILLVVLFVVGAYLVDKARE